MWRYRGHSGREKKPNANGGKHAKSEHIMCVKQHTHTYRCVAHMMNGPMDQYPDE